MLPQPVKASAAKNALPVSESRKATKVTAVQPSLSPLVPSKTDSTKTPPLPTKKPPEIPVHAPDTADAKFKAAQEKAKLSGVHTLTQKDIDGLSQDQIKALRGY
jgi:hypothetical protein